MYLLVLTLASLVAGDLLHLCSLNRRVCAVCTYKLQTWHRHVNVSCRDAQAHDAMNALKTNLRQEHWETLSWGSTCHQLMTSWQMATLLVETHPQW